MYSGNKPRLRVIGWGNVVLGWALPSRLILEIILNEHYASEAVPCVLAFSMAMLLTPATVLGGRAVLWGRKSVLSWTALCSGLWAGFSAVGVGAWGLCAFFQGLPHMISNQMWSLSPWEFPVFMDVLLFLWWQYCPLVVWAEARKANLSIQRPRLIALLSVGVLVGALARIGQLACDVNVYFAVQR